MKSHRGPFAVVACLCAAVVARGDAEKVFLRLEPGGPTGVLNTVAFSPDGDRIYAAGYDKVVRVWARGQAGAFTLSKIAYRVPVGPGLDGTVNAVAASPDGEWLAVGGLGLVTGRADFRTVGMVVPTSALTPSMREDQGTITVFDVNNERAVKVLRGHAGPIRALAFLPKRDGAPPLLVSAATELTDTAGKYTAHVRLWDVAKAQSLAEATIDVKSPTAAVTLTGWRTGPAPKDAAVAVAWADSKVRVWDVASATIDDAPDGRADTAVAPVSAGEFLTASFVSPDAAVRRWRAESGKAPQQRADSELRVPPEDPRRGPFLVPYDLAAFPSRIDGPIDRAVLLARRQGAKVSDDDEDVLLLLDLSRNTVLSRRTLGPSGFNHRRVAAAPTGQTIAVSDADRQQVLVFAAADLVGDKEVPPQALRSVGVSFQAVGFRKNGDAPGLFLQEDGGARMVFDFNNRRLAPDGDAWKDDSLKPTGWKLDIQEGKRGVPGSVTVAGPQFEAKTIVLGEDVVPTACALLPPRKGQPFGPVLAVGWLDRYRQPWLALYDVQSGIQVRQLAGHVAAVRSLAFSADGRLLASVAGDQTVCVWTMTNLGEVLGKVGALPGVVVAASGTGVAVEQAPADSPLKKGDAIEGLVEGGKVRPLATMNDFYTALFNAKPGAPIVLSVRSAGAARAANVSVPVAQGADENKPLLSLFVTRGGAPATRHWIAWTSMGPYDASSRGAEEYLGWHFNPDKAGAPVDFARADKYRDDYESQGVLADLIRRANFGDGYEDWKKRPAPELEMSIDGVDPGGLRLLDRPLVRTRALTLRVRLPRDFPSDRATALRWRLDDGAWQPLGDPQERAWSADLAPLAWGRGPHVVTVRMETDGGRRQFDQTTGFTYLPAPPRIEFPKEWLEKHFAATAGASPQAAVKQATFTLEARVAPGTPGEEVRVALRRNDDEPVTAHGGDVRQEFTLKEGDNVLEIRATNAGASKGLEAEETTVRRLRVNYYRERPAPTVALYSVAPRIDGAAPLPVRLGEMVPLSVSKVRIVGRITAEDALQEAKCDDRPLAGFEAGKAKQFDFDEEVALKPGEQTVAFQARMKDGPAGTASVRLAYQPPTAAILSLRPVEGSKLYAKEVELRAELAPPDDPHPCTAEVLVNGVRQAKLPLDADGRVLRSNITLEPGANTVVVKLSNAWGAAAVRELRLRYLRPPQIVKFEPPAEVDRAVRDFTAEVESPAELPPCEARLNDLLFRDDRLQAELEDREKGLWKVTLRDAPLREGDNALSLLVANKDDVSQKPASARVRYTKPKPPAPVVRFRDYRAGETYNVAAPEAALAFTVESTTPLKRVELRGEDDAVLFRAEAGGLKVEQEVRVRLRPARPTAFRVVAVNDGDEVQAAVTLQVPKRPAYVVIDRLDSLRPGGKTFVPSRNDAQGRTVFETVTEGRVVLHGRILWSDPNDARFRRRIELRVYANDFQQIPAVAQPPRPDQSECTFTATVLLTQAKDNVIEVELPELTPRADGQRSACIVRQCTNPIRGRRLHLVAIGVGEKDGAALKAQALKAVGARQTASDDCRMEAPPVFEEVVAYEPLVGGVSKGQMLDRLMSVQQVIRAAAPEDQDAAVSEVVLIYYQGREMITPEGDYLLSDDFKENQDLEETALSCRDLVDLFGEARGVQVVMLDAERVAPAKADADAGTADAFDGSRLGVFHSSWFGGKAPTTHLLALLAQGWPKASTLGDLATQVNDLCQQLSPELRFSKHLPGDLTQLEFGGKP